MLIRKVTRNNYEKLQNTHVEDTCTSFLGYTGPSCLRPPLGGGGLPTLVSTLHQFLLLGRSDFRALKRQYFAVHEMVLVSCHEILCNKGGHKAVPGTCLCWWRPETALVSP